MKNQLLDPRTFKNKLSDLQTVKNMVNLFTECSAEIDLDNMEVVITAPAADVETADKQLWKATKMTFILDDITTLTSWWDHEGHRTGLRLFDWDTCKNNI
ncbi:MAG: hypothetical protein IJW55_07545 [Clostridia bacterium]|nr:hypothetical protein [Clostridia bacterium]